VDGMRNQVAPSIVILSGFLLLPVLPVQEKAFVPDLSQIADGKTWKIVGRKVTTLATDGKTVVRFDENSGFGIAWLPGDSYGNCAIEFDVRGKNVDQHSFVGVAFRGVDENTHDAVYFRPFNFRSADAARRSHSVQYVSHPGNTWKLLRDNHPGMFEKPVIPAPDPDSWFHVKVVIDSPKVSVFVNSATDPSLVVEQLNKRKRGWIGLWVGDGSGGDFANLNIIPVK
jgi:hypothetical protein